MILLTDIYEPLLLIFIACDPLAFILDFTACSHLLLEGLFLMPFYTGCSRQNTDLLVCSMVLFATCCGMVLSRFSHVQLFSTPYSPPGSSVHENTGVGYHELLQEILPTQGLNLSLLCFLHSRWVLYN